MAKPSEKRVLVVDDEEDVVTFLSMALEDAGFQTDSARSADEALEKVKASPPDFISLDMIMPGKSGIVLFHELHKNPAWSKIPVLFVTGHAKDERVKHDMDAAAALADSTLSGPATYLEKPVTAEKFVQAVAAALGVELPESAHGTEPEGDVRGELEQLIRTAGPEALQEALRLLRSKP
jgi:CheY-like chemotaxis protein